MPSRDPNSVWRRMFRRTGSILCTLGLVVIAFLTVSLAEGFPVKVLVVTSSSMEPTLHCAGAPGCLSLHPDRLVFFRWAYGWLGSPARGDIVLIKLLPTHEKCEAGQLIVKRVIGLGGDRIRETRGVIFRDGSPLKTSSTQPSTKNFGPVQVPNGEFFVLGDNVAISCDSRTFGLIARSQVLGKLVLRLR